MLHLNSLYPFSSSLDSGQCWYHLKLVKHLRWVVVTSDNSLPRYPGVGPAEVLIAPFEGTAQFFATCPDNLEKRALTELRNLSIL